LEFVTGFDFLTSFNMTSAVQQSCTGVD